MYIYIYIFIMYTYMCIYIYILRRLPQYRGETVTSASLRKTSTIAQRHVEILAREIP